MQKKCISGDYINKNLQQGKKNDDLQGGARIEDQKRQLFKITAALVREHLKRNLFLHASLAKGPPVASIPASGW